MSSSSSGQFITPANGRIPPFDDGQPVQGFSSVLRASNGDFLVMSDNGVTHVRVTSMLHVVMPRTYTFVARLRRRDVAWLSGSARGSVSHRRPWVAHVDRQ